MAKVSAEKLVKDFSKKLIDQIGLEAKIETSSKDDIIEVKVVGENLGALIGYHGETLESLQLVLSLMLNRTLKEDDWKRVLVDVGNWRQERNEALYSMVEKAASEIDSTNVSKISLPPMSASQRREVHIIVADSFKGFQTESEGQEPYRKVFLVKGS